jgi:hypothetical protein
VFRSLATFVKCGFSLYTRTCINRILRDFVLRRNQLPQERLHRYVFHLSSCAKIHRQASRMDILLSSRRSTGFQSRRNHSDMVELSAGHICLPSETVQDLETMPVIPGPNFHGHPCRALYALLRRWPPISPQPSLVLDPSRWIYHSQTGVTACPI